MIELILPWSPTVNSYYVKSKTHVFISTKGKNFREDVAEAIAQQVPDLMLGDMKMLVEVVLFPPDRRKRDLDNHMKALLDSLAKAGIWEDDSQIDQLHIYRGEVVDKGLIHMRIFEAGPCIKKNTRVAD